MLIYMDEINFISMYADIFCHVLHAVLKKGPCYVFRLALVQPALSIMIRKCHLSFWFKTCPRC